MTAFQSRPLPGRVARVLRARLLAAHRREPFSAADPRAATRRVVATAERLGLTATIYRGGLDLHDSEVDHLWVEIDGRVIDVAFPLFSRDFVTRLRRFVVGEAEVDELAHVAVEAGLDQRVFGLFPPAFAYRGEPVWSARFR